MKLFSESAEYQELVIILASISNNNKKQIIQKNYPELWNWIVSTVDFLYPGHNEPEKAYIFLVTNYPVELICSCGKTKRYVVGRYMCEKACPAVKQKRLQTNIEKYGASSPLGNKLIREKAKQTLFQNYQVENPSQSKEISSKKIETCQKNFNCDFPMQSPQVQEKCKTTFLNLYGGWPTTNQDIREKMIASCREKYGCDWTIQSKKVRNKIQQTEKIKWGGHHSQDPEVQSKQKDSKRKTCENRYGGPNEHYAHISKAAFEILNDPNKFAELLQQNSCFSMAQTLGVKSTVISTRHKKFGLDIIRAKGTSSYENEIATWLQEMNLTFYKDRSILNGKELDFYIPAHHVAIEFQGDFWHMNPKLFSPSDIHPFKKITAEEIWDRDIWKLLECKAKQIQLLQIWENDWKCEKESVKKMIKSYLNL